MIRFQDGEYARLRENHTWLRSLGTPDPIGIASMLEPAAGAIHFADRRRASSLTGLPPGSCAVVPPGVPLPEGLRRCDQDDPKAAVGRLMIALREIRRRSDFRQLAGAWIAADTILPDTCRIEPGVVIMQDVVIGPGIEIGANAVIRPGTRIGKDARIGSGAVLGADGYGYVYREGQALFQLPHLGGVELGEACDIGPNSVICSGTIDPTRIGARCKIDGSVYIGHNAALGADCAVIAGAVVGGSARLGLGVAVNTAAMVKGKVMVGDRAVIGAGAVVMKDVAAGQTVMGDVAGEMRARLRRDAWLDQQARQGG
ncbi:MAG: hypothetical protein FJX46_01820 [Alphaproteobacteria bacterium]|nr:hypothetical protein [Alphaproteobacteria bacterium]